MSLWLGAWITGTGVTTTQKSTSRLVEPNSPEPGSDAVRVLRVFKEIVCMPRGDRLIIKDIGEHWPILVFNRSPWSDRLAAPRSMTRPSSEARRKVLFARCLHINQ
jgi:hypothetical protein